MYPTSGLRGCRPALTLGAAVAICGVLVAAPSPVVEPVARIEFEIVANRVVFPVHVGKSGPLSILLDTGATFDGVYLFHEQQIAELGLTDLTEYRVAGAGSGEPSRTVMADGMTLRAGGLEFTGQRVIVSRSATTQRFPRDGVIGHTLFGSWVVEIDYDEGELRLHEPEGFTADASWDSLELTLRRGIPFVQAGVVVDGEDELPLHVPRLLHGRTSVSATVPGGTPGESGSPSVATPDPAFTSRKSA